MSYDDQQIIALQESLLQDNTSGPYTGDGSVDYHGHPVLKSRTGNWKACYFILGCEGCERLAFHSIDKNLVNYLSGELHVGNVSAARTVTTWSGACSLTPLIGAFLADAYWGKYWTIAVTSTTYMIGLCLLILSASVPALMPTECTDSGCPSPSPAQYAVLFAGLYLMALGSGGIKPCVSSFGADQFDDTDASERVKKGSFFNWFYFSVSIGALLATTLVVWIQENVGWGAGFAIPTFFMGIAIASFFSGTRLYRFQRPGRSPLTRMYLEVVASIRGIKLELPNDSTSQCETLEKSSVIEERRIIEHSSKFLDSVAVPLDAEMNAVTQVKEVTILMRMFPIWTTGIVYSAVFAQTTTVFVEQGRVMDRSIGSFTIPAASLSMFLMIGIMSWLPIFDRFLIPLARKLTGTEKGVTELQRIGVGLFLSMLPMLFAAFLEMRRLALAKELGLVDENVAVPLSICWQIPQFLLMGIADANAYVGKLEFFYDQSPDAMRSLGTALCLLITSMGDFLSSLILTLVTVITTSGGNPGWIPDNLNNGQLHKYFFMWASLSFLNLLVFVFFATRYKDKKTS
ncbi:hypothetical protein vseg_015805 [Gypsophila vaccaria]